MRYRRDWSFSFPWHTSKPPWCDLPLAQLRSYFFSSLVTRRSPLSLFTRACSSPSAALAMGILLVYAEFMLEEKDFQRKADAAFDNLKKRLLVLGDEHGFDVEGEAGKLEVVFEEPEEAKFVISPNTPVPEIWLSPLSTSFT